MIEQFLAFLKILRDDPSDSNRLIFADWLEEYVSEELAQQVRNGDLSSVSLPQIAGRDKGRATKRKLVTPLLLWADVPLGYRDIDDRKIVPVAANEDRCIACTRPWLNSMGPFRRYLWCPYSARKGLGGFCLIHFRQKEALGVISWSDEMERTRRTS